MRLSLIARAMAGFTVCALAAPLQGVTGQESVESLYVSRGPTTSDTVVIFAQGGPFGDLRPDLVGTLPGMAGRLQVTVHQPWTRNANILADRTGVDGLTVTELTNAAVAALDRVVQHFLDQDVPVCVVGHSYGALLTLKWLVAHHRPVRVQVLAGRLAFPEIVWTNFRDGRLWWFPDGQTPTALDGPAPDSRVVPMRLQAEVGAPRYMQLLRNRDLSHVTFVYGDRDRLVGALTTAEHDFLVQHGANVIRLPGGDHRDMFSEQYADLLGSAFVCGSS